jgi:16S rRNA (adenine1518-N6/adenine1519-N6)-dimethyltransferase
MDHPKARLEKLGAGARKSLSQNFLVSPHWVDKLTDVIVSSSNVDEIWEVGPGLGALTLQLVTKTKLPVRIFEYDRKLAADLREKFTGVEVVEGDFLDVDLVARARGKRIALLSNLPYHLSSPVLFKILDERAAFPRLVLTFQKEFAERLIAKPSTKAYGSLSVLMQLTFQMTSIGILPPGAFYPKPKIDSQAVLFTPLPDLPVPFEPLRQMVKAAFAHRRKKMSSNLSALYERPRVEAALGHLGISVMARPEELVPTQFVALAQQLLTERP